MEGLIAIGAGIAALAEATAIYGLVVALVILFVV